MGIFSDILVTEGRMLTLHGHEIFLYTFCGNTHHLKNPQIAAVTNDGVIMSLLSEKWRNVTIFSVVVDGKCFKVHINFWVLNNLWA